MLMLKALVYNIFAPDLLRCAQNFPSFITYTLKLSPLSSMIPKYFTWFLHARSLSPILILHLCIFLRLFNMLVFSLLLFIFNFYFFVYTNKSLRWICGVSVEGYIAVVGDQDDWVGYTCIKKRSEKWALWHSCRYFSDSGSCTRY